MSDKDTVDDNEMKDEYDFRDGERGKYYNQYLKTLHWSFWKKVRFIFFSIFYKRQWPWCRCGIIHAGPYADIDRIRHDCFHEIYLWNISHPQLNTLQVMCPNCGMSWLVKPLENTQCKKQ